MIADTAPRSVGVRVLQRFKSPSDVFLAVRIVGWACVMPILKRAIPLQTLVHLVRRTGRRDRDGLR